MASRVSFSQLLRNEDIIFSYLFRSAPVPNGKMAIRDWCQMEKRLFGTGAFHQYFFIRDQIFERDQCRLAIFFMKGTSAEQPFFHSAPVPNSLFSIRHQSRMSIFVNGTRLCILHLIHKSGPVHQKLPFGTGPVHQK